MSHAYRYFNAQTFTSLDTATVEEIPSMPSGRAPQYVRLIAGSGSVFVKFKTSSSPEPITDGLLINQYESVCINVSGYSHIEMLENETDSSLNLAVVDS